MRVSNKCKICQNPVRSAKMVHEECLENQALEQLEKEILEKKETKKTVQNKPKYEPDYLISGAGA